MVLLVSMLIFGLFLISGFLFPVRTQRYYRLRRPRYTPPGSLIGLIWMILYVMISYSYSAYFFASHPIEPHVIALMLINYFLNQAYPYIQFHLQKLWWATWDAVLLTISTLLLMISIQDYPPSSYLLIPYFCWTLFASILSYQIASLNE